MPGKMVNIVGTNTWFNLDSVVQAIFARTQKGEIYLTLVFPNGQQDIHDDTQIKEIANELKIVAPRP